MNYPAAMFYLTLIVTVINILVGISNWWAGRDKVTKTRFDALTEEIGEIKTRLANVTGSCGGHAMMDTRLDGHNTRLGQHKELIDMLAGEVKHLPKSEDLGNIHKRVDAVFRSTDCIRGELKAISNNMALLLEYHLKER